MNQLVMMTNYFLLTQDQPLRHEPPALTSVFVHLGFINSTEHCLAYCMFLDVGNVLRMALMLLSQRVTVNVCD